MKVNSKTTNAATLVCHQGGQRTVNGIIGNTRRGIQVDQTLDPDSNNPVANKPVSNALAALAGKIDASLQKPTGLTKTKLVGVGASGQENIEIGDNLTLTDGKLSAAGGGKSVPPTLWLIDLDNLEARTTITEEEYNNLKNGLYNQVIYFPDTDYNDAYYISKLIYVFNEFYFVQCHGVYDDTLNCDKIVSLIDYRVTIGEKDTSGNYPITIEKEDVIPFGSGGSDGSGIQIVDCTLTDQEDITKGGTVDNVPEAPFLLRIPLNLKNEGSYGKHLVDNILVPMNYTYGSFEHSGEGKVVPDKYSGTGFALTDYYYVEADISTKKVTIVKQINASYIMLPVDMPTKTSPTVNISNPNQDILVQPMLVSQNFASDGIVLYGYLFSWVSPVYSKNNVMFYYTAEYGDITSTLTITYHEIPSSTTTITFED